jgi:hypothetical protein
VRGKVGTAESPLLVRLQPQQLTVMISRPSPLALKGMNLRTRRTCLVVWKNLECDRKKQEEIRDHF